MYEISIFSTEPFCLAHYPSAFHSVMFNPVEPRLLATANSKEGVGLWDIRKPQRYDLAVLVLCCSISFPGEVMAYYSLSLSLFFFFLLKVRTCDGKKRCRPKLAAMLVELN